MRRDAAVARLRVLGARAVPALITLLSSGTSSRACAAALEALEGAELSPRDAERVREARAAVAPDPGNDSVFDDPRAAREWLDAHAGGPLSPLHAAVAAIRERERREPSARLRQEWLMTRGAVHAALARRGSRVAVYDLREAFDAAQGALPVDFLSAIGVIGDASCLEPLARAWAASPGDAWWRDHLCQTAQDILKREKLTGRSAVVKRVRAKYIGFL